MDFIIFRFDNMYKVLGFNEIRTKFVTFKRIN